MEFQEVLRRRHSVRRFSNRQVRRETLFEIVNDARRSPSWLNAQERNVYAAIRETAKNIRKEFMSRSEKEMIGISDFSFTHRNEWSTQAQKNMGGFVNDMEQFLGEDSEEYMRVQDTLFDAPVILYLTLPKGASNWAVLDLGAFEMSVMLAAASRGVDSVVAYAFVKYSDIIRKYLDIPDTEDIIIGIGLGYALEDAKLNQFRSNRVPFEQVMQIKG